MQAVRTHSSELVTTGQKSGRWLPGPSVVERLGLGGVVPVKRILRRRSTQQASAETSDRYCFQSELAVEQDSDGVL
ncbi:hypothetical protein NDU88_007250 [Pleurodeles waltl]|uniref:Uncharacterized protein n=1 Tax=Pleurodeles waltl TaxID=8319 RepID=A0AAV7UP25_PLEWA|nr:hypothetical protein NDU88_007250 [Pleurodeles waltl]